MMLVMVAWPKRSWMHLAILPISMARMVENGDGRESRKVMMLCFGRMGSRLVSHFRLGFLRVRTRE